MEKFTILYIDDEINNLNSLKAAFRRDYNVLTADTVEKGMALLDENEVAVLIVDQRMPEMTGVQLLEAVARKNEDVVKMILTGFSDVQPILEAINTGRLFRYILKPWDVNEVKTAIDSGIKLYQLTKQNKALYQQAKEEVRRHKRIINILKKYIPSHLITALEDAESPESASFSEHRVVSSVIIRLDELAQQVQQLDMHAATKIMHDFFSVVSNSTAKNEGIILEFQGDKLLLIFGAPVMPTLDFPSNAVTCGLEILDNFNSVVIKDNAQLLHDTP